MRTETHVLCEPQEEYDLTEAELEEIQTFDYKAHALRANQFETVLISQRFLIIS